MKRPLTREDLARHVQAVVRDSGSFNRRDEGWLGAERRFTVSSMDSSLATLLAGLAYAWLPMHMVAEMLENKRLERLPLVSGGSRVVMLYIVVVRPEIQGPAARAAVQALGRSNPTGGKAAT